MPGHAAPPVVTVLDKTLDGAMVRWSRTVDDAREMLAVLVATREGVKVGPRVYLTEIPEEWVAAAKAAYRALADGAGVSHLATHRYRFQGGGPLDPVTPPAGAEQDG